MTRRLPIWATASAAYRHLEKRAVYAVLFVGSLTITLLAILFWLIDSTGPGILVMMLSVAIYAVCWLSIAFSWHRDYLWLEAELTGRESIFGPIVYGLQLFGISSLSGAILIPMGILVILADEISGNVFSELAKLVTDRDRPLGILTPLLILIVPYVFARLTLALPASAVGDVDIGLWASWKHTRGNGLRLLGAWFVAAIPPMVLAFLCLVAGSPDNIRDWLILRTVIYTIGFGFIVVAVLNTLSVMSIAYAFLVEKRAVPKPTVTPKPKHLEATGAIIRSRR